MRIFTNPLLILQLLLATSAAIAETPNDWRTNCSGIYNLCGFEDENRNPVTPKMFEQVRQFSEGMAAVQLNGLWGYISPDGLFVIPAKFEFASDFRFGLAEVIVDGHAGAIDTHGNIVVAPEFRSIIPLTSNVVIASDWGEGRSLRSGKLDDNPAPTRSGLFEIGKGWVTEEVLRFSEFDATNGGLIWASRRGSPNGYGLMSLEGAWITEPQYRIVQKLHDDRALVQDWDERWGAVDGRGAIAISPQFEWLGFFMRGFGSIRNDDQKALIRPNGALVGGRHFDDVLRNETGVFPSVLLDGYWYGVDDNETLVDDPRDGQIYLRCTNGSTIRYMRGLFQMFDNSGTLLTDQLFERLHTGNTHNFGRGERPVENCDDPFSVLLDGAWNYLSSDGKLLFDTPPFDTQYSFNNGHAIFGLNGRSGMIDAEGTIVFDPIYHYLSIRDDGILRFKLNKGDDIRGMYFDGNEITLPPPDNRRNTLTCRNGTTVFRDGALYGLKVEEGQVLIPADYRVLMCYEFGISWAVEVGGKAWCPLDRNAERIAAIDCVELRYPYEQSHTTPEQLDDDPFESNVLWVRAKYEFGLGDRPTPPAWIPWEGWIEPSAEEIPWKTLIEPSAD